ncbi:hypothetical protein A4X13_0g3372 [Tilletia indica]|uniref:Uncharacterized protein n=1 Tax=Tilletia indica TaxID=43049 RepID=A0A177TF14_9BASI|nr:hypothetical protein A4X13_0g3372 [Tilletia indica]
MNNDQEERRDEKRICLLDGENWTKWEFQIEETLRGKKTWKAVDPGTAPAANASQEKKDDWDEMCDLAFSVMSLNCSASIQGDIANKNKERKTNGEKRMSPKELFEYLRSEYASTSLQARLGIKRRLAAALKDPQPSMRDHISKVGGFYTQLAEIGFPVQEDERCISLLDSLPDAYQHFVRNSLKITTWSELRIAILEEEALIKRFEEKSTPARNETAFVVGSSTGESAQSNNSNYRRGAPGGYRSNYRGRGGRGGYSRFGSTGPFQGTCHICKQPGHQKYECPHKDAFEAFQQGLGGNAHRERAAVVQEERVELEAPTAEGSGVGDFGFGWACSVGSPQLGSKYFILDTASSRHIVANGNQLADYRPAPQGTGIECANGGMMAVEGYGTLKVITEEGTTITLLDVAHCPSTIGNLIGGKRLTNSGCKITFDDCSATVINTKSDRLIMKADVRGGNWVVQLHTIPDIAAVLAGEPKIDSAAVHAHHALAHVNKKVLQAAAASGLIPGLPKILGQLGFCSACAQGKLASTPHPRLCPHERASRAMELIHADVFGPERMKEAAALGGYRYGLMLVDDFTKHVWVKLLHLKSDAVKALKDFHLAASTRLPDLPISRVRTDGALEFKRTDLIQFWLEHGVTHESTARYNPQSNGVAERNIRTITEMTRTMLIAAKLPTFFWPAAVETAVRVKNRVTASGLKAGKTPYEMLYARPPSKEKFRPFGCVAWAKRASTERSGKFDSKARACVYLGPAFRGSSRLWDPEKGKEIIEHSVAFDEFGDASKLLQPAALGSSNDFSPSGRPAAPHSVPTQQGRVPPVLQNAMRRALQADAVPSGAISTAQMIAAGRPVAAQALSELTATLQARASQGSRAQGDGRERRSGSSGARATEGAGQVDQRQRVGGAGQAEERQRAERVGQVGEQRTEGDRIEEQRTEGARIGEQRTEGARIGEQRTEGARVGEKRTEGAREVREGAGRGQQEPEGERAGLDGGERRSGRIAGADPEFGLLGSRKRKEPGDVCFAVLDPEDVAYDDPKTIAEALSRPDRDAWLEAMHVEVRSHIKRGTWRVVKRYGKANLISSKWVLRLKKNADGSIQKYKARLVARGFTQVEGVDFDETFAPTSRLQNMRLLFAVAAALDLDVHQIDYETAYLNAKLQNEIFMLPPEGMDLLGHDFLPDDALELMLALYGLKQSGHEWHRVLREALKTLKFEQCKIDPTMFVREGANPAILLVYVDDILVAAPRGGGIEGVKKELLELFKGTDLGPAHHCLGIRISRNWEEETITLDQERYTEEVLARFGMSDCNPAKTPMDSKGSLRKAVDGEARADIRLYQAIVGCLAYLAQGTRPDLAYAVSTLGKFSSDPSSIHLIAAKRVLRYLRKTSGAKLTFGGRKDEELQMEGFVDSDWAADRDDRRSTSGFVFTIGGGAVSWGSRKQGAVALSTAEAEYIAAGVAGREAMLLSGALKAAGQDIGTVTVHCDNQAAIQLVKNPGSHHDRSKHIDIAHHWIRDKTQEGAFAFQYIPTDLNPADAFTKPLGQIKHQQHAQAIGMALALGLWEHAGPA